MSNVKRKSNIELLRIIAMLLIVSFHIVYKSGYTYDYFSIQTFIVKFFYFFGELGVNLFVLIFGYFAIKGKFSLRKIILLILQTDFYYIIFAILSKILGFHIIGDTLRDYILIFFPVILNKYWFVTCYILVYILSPYLNKFILSFNQQEFKKFLLTILIIWSFINTLFGFFYNSSEVILYYTRFIWIIIVYFIGAYIRLYSLKLFNRKNNTIKTIIFSFLIMVISIPIFHKFRCVFNYIGTKEIAYFWTPNNPLMLILSIAIFELFLKLDIGSKKIINNVSKTTLGVYLIQDNILLPALLGKINIISMLNSKFSLLYIIFITASIFAIAMIIELIRKIIEERIIMNIFKLKCLKRLQKNIKIFYKKLQNMI